MDRLQAMRLLVAAVEGGSLSAAGRATGTPLATVSRRISEMESALGTRLLVRGTRRLTETEAGRAQQKPAQTIDNPSKDAVHDGSPEAVAIN